MASAGEKFRIARTAKTKLSRRGSTAPQQGGCFQAQKYCEKVERQLQFYIAAQVQKGEKRVSARNHPPADASEGVIRFHCVSTRQENSGKIY
jgi:hypothetical protein